jgi:hypothetical protein
VAKEGELMPRPRRSSTPAPELIDAQLKLEIGQHGYTLAELEAAWSEYGAEVLDAYRWYARPWAWWAFEAHEDRPLDSAAETARLAELGALRDEELDGLARRAAEAQQRIGTDRERLADGDSLDARTVDLHERTREA